MWECGNKNGVEVSRLSGAESVVGQRGKFESYALLNRKPMEIFKDTRYNTILFYYSRRQTAAKVTYTSTIV